MLKHIINKNILKIKISRKNERKPTANASMYDINIVTLGKNIPCF